MYQESYLRYAIQEVHGGNRQITSEMPTLARQGIVDKGAKIKFSYQGFYLGYAYLSQTVYMGMK